MSRCSAARPMTAASPTASLLPRNTSPSSSNRDLGQDCHCEEPSGDEAISDGVCIRIRRPAGRLAMTRLHRAECAALFRQAYDSGITDRLVAPEEYSQNSSNLNQNPLPR